MKDSCSTAIAAVLLCSALTPRPAYAEVVGVSDEAGSRASAVDWAHAQHYDVFLGEFRFSPPRILLRRGEAYALRLENQGRFRHTFTAPEFFHAVAFRVNGDAMEAEQSDGSLSLAAGEVREIDLVPLQAGVYALECTKPLHGLFGMKGDIVVQ